jgi:hypothetical protein
VALSSDAYDNPGTTESGDVPAGTSPPTEASATLLCIKINQLQARDKRSRATRVSAESMWLVTISSRKGDGLAGTIRRALQEHPSRASNQRSSVRALMVSLCLKP